MIITLMIIMIFSVLGLTLMAVSMNSVKMSAGEREDQAAFYIAEGALNTEMKIVDKKVSDAYANNTSETSFYNSLITMIIKNNQPSTAVFENTLGHLPSAKITIMEMNKNNPRDYKIISTGYINKKKRTVVQEFSLEWKSKAGNSYNTAVLVKDKIIISNGTIKGDLATTSKGNIVDAKGNTVNDSPSIIATGGNLQGSLSVPTEYTGNALSKLSWMTNFPEVTKKNIGEFPKLPEFPIIPAVAFAQNSKELNSYVIVNNRALSVQVDGNQEQSKHTYNLLSSTKFDKIELISNEVLYLDLKNQDKFIVVDKLNLTNGHIFIKNGGNLTIYVTGDFTMGSGSTINSNGQINQVNIFLKGSDVSGNPKNFTLSGSQKVFGSLYAENANINLTAGGGFNGNIFTGGKEFNVAGGTWTTAPLIFAPNAVFKHSNGTIKGVIITKTFELSGGAYLEYDDIDMKVGPISQEGIAQSDPSGKIELFKKKLTEK